MCMYLRDGAVTAIVLTGGYYYSSYPFFFTYTWVGWGAPDSPVAAPTYAAPVRYACIHRTNCISNIVDNPMQILSRAAATETKCVTYHTRIP